LSIKLIDLLQHTRQSKREIKVFSLFFIIVTILAFFGSGCSQIQEISQSTNTPNFDQGVQSTQTIPSANPSPTIFKLTETPSSVSTAGLPPQPTPTFTITPTLAPEAWKSMPVIPTLSGQAIQIFRSGLQMGRNPHAFSKIGDCEARTTWFLSDFDASETAYNLGEYTNLKETINYFSGSFGRLSLVAKPGFTAASVLVPLWADPAFCNSNETPLACEYRLNNPSFSLIMLGTNDVANPDTFEPNLRAVIDATISEGILPVLVTKADNLEGDFSLNATIAKLAYEYDIPLWNFWLAVQPLPNHGLDPDGAHLTWSTNDFSDPAHLQEAWPVRNLTALQVLDEIRKAVTSLEH
jgi:hypothetical protein